MEWIIKELINRKIFVKIQIKYPLKNKTFIKNNTNKMKVSRIPEKYKNY